MRKLLTKILSVIVAVTAMLGLVMLPKTAVQANEISTFGAIAGASVKFGKTEEEVGLRFTIDVNKEFYASLGNGVVFGALITTRNYGSDLGNFVIQDGKEVADEMIADVRFIDDVSKFDSEYENDTFYRYYASVTYNFDEAWQEDLRIALKLDALDDETLKLAKLAALTQELVCRPYYIVNGEVVYADYVSNARSMLKVANAAYLDPIDRKSIDEKFITKYLATIEESDSIVYIEKAESRVIGLSQKDKDALNGAKITADNDASDVEFSIENNILINADTFLADKIEGEYYYVTAFKGNKGYRIKYLYVTMAIDEASDFGVFTLTVEKDLAGIKGYYILTKDIDVSSYEFGKHVYADGNTYFSTGKSKGFMGTFDGLGHTIIGATFKYAGIFGHTTAPTIKNLAFTHVTLNAYYGEVFAHSASRLWGTKFNDDGTPMLNSNGVNDWVLKEPEFYDIYIQVDKATFGTSKRINVLVDNSLPTSSILKNVVVEYLNAESDGVIEKLAETGGYNFGTFGGNESHSGQMNKGFMYENCYSISKTPIYMKSNNGIQYIHLAENQVEITERNKNGYWIDAIGDVTNQLIAQIAKTNKKTFELQDVAPGIKAYDDYGKMTQDAKANADSLETFNKKYWTVVNGVPYWKSIYSTDKVNVVVTDTNSNNIEHIELLDNATELNVSLVDASGFVIPEFVISEVEGLIVDNVNKTIKLANNPTGKGYYLVNITAIVEGIVVEKELQVNYTLEEILVTDKVLYSQVDKELNTESLKQALQKVGVTDFNPEDIDGYYDEPSNSIVQDLELEVIISGTVNNRTVKDSQTAYLFMNNKIYKLNNVYAYTKLIDDLSDLDYLGDRGQLYSEKYLDANNKEQTRYWYETSFTGYYLMTNNIDGIDATAPNGKRLIAGASTSYEIRGGFSGVFDGNGYTISNVTIQSKGLFGSAGDGAVVKNVAFKNIDCIGYYVCIVAHNFDNTDRDGDKVKNIPLLKNVYIEGTNIIKTNPYKGLSNCNGDLSIITQGNYYGYMQNVIVKHTMNDYELTQLRAGKRHGVIMSSYSYGKNYYNHFSDVYILGDVPFKLRRTSAAATDGFTLASNIVELDSGITYKLVVPEGLEKSPFVYLNELLTSTTYKWSMDFEIETDVVGRIDIHRNIKQYIDADAMSKDSTANSTSLSKFDKAYWTIVDGVPTWKTLND